MDPLATLLARDTHDARERLVFGVVTAIDLRIDDSEGVAIECRRYGFEVNMIRPEDECWRQTVLAAAGVGRATQTRTGSSTLSDRP